MNKKSYIALGIALIGALSSCQSSQGFSFFSLSYPSYTNSDFDFDYAYGDKRKLAEYQITREFFEETPILFEGVLLNPANYPEDEDASAFYNPTGSYEADDLSDEWIDFPSYQDDLATLIEGLPEGDITDPEVLQSVLDQSGSNDALIVRQEIDYEETALYHDYENGVYYAFNNFHKTETMTLRRYADPLVSGSGSGQIEYQDGFDDAYTVTEQIRANGYFIYEMRDETFPPGSTSAVDYKITTPRVPGNYMAALLIGGGGAAARFIGELTTMYDQLSYPESETYNPNYAYELSGIKTASDFIMSLQAHVEPHYDEADEEVYGMDLDYEFTIADGIVAQVTAHQVYWAN